MVCPLYKFNGLNMEYPRQYGKKKGQYNRFDVADCYNTDLNCKSWYIRVTLAHAPYTKVLTLLDGAVQARHF